MNKTIKCTICGSTNFIKKDLRTEDCLDVPSLLILGVSAYVCQECGHVEIFDYKIAASAKNNSKEKKN